MMHLKSIIENDVNYEKNKVDLFKHGGHKKVKYVCCKVGDYWWRLTRMQWAEHKQILYATLCSRLKHNKPVEKVLYNKNELPTKPRCIKR